MLTKDKLEYAVDRQALAAEQRAPMPNINLDQISTEDLRAALEARDAAKTERR